MSYPLSDESAVYPAAHVEPLGVDPCIACVFSLVEVMLCHSIVADDLDFISIVKLADLVAVVIAGLGTKCKPSGLYSVDCSNGAFTEAFFNIKKLSFTDSGMKRQYMYTAHCKPDTSLLSLSNIALS